MNDPKPLAWWRVGMVWLVLSGPAAVVLAGSATMVLAFRHADPVITERPATAAAAMPAVQARNHAATPAGREARRWWPPAGR